MRTPRVYIPEIAHTLRVGDVYELPRNAAHHVATVLRAKLGAQIDLFDGRGQELSGSLLNASRHTTAIQIDSIVCRAPPSAPKLIAAFAIARGDRMDFAIQKATELGTDAIQPLVSERTVVRLKADGFKRKLSHWQSVAVAACEQCGRAYLPQIEPPLGLLDWLSQIEPLVSAPDNVGLLLAPQSSGSLAATMHARTAPEHVILLSGPEGGFSESEERAAQAVGFESVNLGPRVLRAETAVVAALSCAQLLWGDLGPLASSGELKNRSPQVATRR